jgi:hypothetical protein
MGNTMNAAELTAIRDSLKFDAVTLAACLGISHDQCRKLLCGQTKIAPEIAHAALERVHIEQALDRQRWAKYDAWLAEQPKFMSEIEA